jgi:hypothetical protein
MMFDLKIPMAVFRFSMAHRAAFAAVAISLSLLGGAKGAAAGTITPVTLGTASTYGVLIGTGETLTLNGGFNLSGNIGVGASDTVNLSGNNAISGTAYEDSDVNYNASGNTSVSGGVVTQSMTSVLSAAASASTAAKNDTTGSILSGYGSSISVTSAATSVAIKALSSGENILNISALSLSNGTLTFDDNGHSGAKFIINITGNLTASGANALTIKGINGATGADILFNVTGAGSSVSLTGNNATYIGTILAPAANVTIGGNGTLTGNILAGFNNAGKSYTVGEQSSGFNITSLGYKPSTVTKTPEPSTIALFGFGVVGLAIARRRWGSARA